jgi:NAD+ diphosphatase
MDFNYCPKCGAKGCVQKLDNTNYECSECQWHFWNNAKATVALALVDGTQVLYNKRGIKPNLGMYDLPGGFVDYGETAQLAAIREAKEEMSVDINEADLELIAAYHNDYNPGVSTVDIVFLVRKWSGKLDPKSDSASLEWKSFEFITDPLFCEKHYNGLEKLLAEITLTT